MFQGAISRWAVQLRVRWLAVAALLLLALPARAEEALAPVAGSLELHVQLHDVDDDRRKPLERLARKAVQQVEDDLMTQLSGDLHVEFVGTPEAFKRVMQAHGAQGWPENWISGLALLDQDRVIVQVNGPGALLTSEVVRHELAHVALHALSGGANLPRWYHEGVAMYLAGEATFERLRQQAGAAAFGELESLGQLNRGFGNENQVAAERAYAVSAGFVRFALMRSGDRRSILLLHARMRAGLDFPSAFTATFGTPQEALYSVYAAQIGQHASRWAVVVSDGMVWGLVSVLALFAMATAWRNRARFDTETEPLDLEAIAAAGAAAVRPWRQRDFAERPLQVADAGMLALDDEPELPPELTADRPVSPTIH